MRAMVPAVVGLLVARWPPGAGTQPETDADRLRAWDRLDQPYLTVYQAVREQGINPAYDRRPYLQNTLCRAWTLLFNVLQEVAENPARGGEAAWMAGRPAELVRSSLRGERVYHHRFTGRAALGQVDAAVDRGRAQYGAGQPVEPDLAMLMVTMADSELGPGWRRATADDLDCRSDTRSYVPSRDLEEAKLCNG